ncbi:MAG TPA: hypothetical protein EYG69_04690 [Campylobacterales bacterium]|nr:hypothetical protein [Campylobacterales bacterium]
MKWLNDFKRAIIEENVSDIVELTKTPPSFEPLALEIQNEILALLDEATKLIKNHQNSILDEMKKIKKTEKFLKKEDGNYSFDMSF